MDLAARDRRPAARNMLADDEFQRHQKLYRQQLRQVRETLVAKVTDDWQQQQYQARNTMYAACASVPLLLLACFTAFRAGRSTTPPTLPERAPTPLFAHAEPEAHAGPQPCPPEGAATLSAATTADNDLPAEDVSLESFAPPNPVQPPPEAVSSPQEAEPETVGLPPDDAVEPRGEPDPVEPKAPAVEASVSEPKPEPQIEYPANDDVDAVVEAAETKMNRDVEAVLAKAERATAALLDDKGEQNAAEPVTEEDAPEPAGEPPQPTQETSRVEQISGEEPDDDVESALAAAEEMAATASGNCIPQAAPDPIQSSDMPDQADQIEKALTAAEVLASADNRQ
jgi:hypothetical protein